jgi:hypothetical protein
LAERTDLDTLYTDGGYGGAALDQSLTDKGIALFQTGIRGKKLRQDRLSFHQFSIHLDEAGLPTEVTCPYGQIAPVEVGSQKKGYVARFSVSICETCPFHQVRKCPTRLRKRKQFYGLYFMPSKKMLALRRARSKVFQITKRNPRAAIEATVMAVKLPFPKGKLPVRGRFRIFYMMIGSAAINNVRHIQRNLALKSKNLLLNSFCLFRRSYFLVTLDVFLDYYYFKNLVFAEESLME